MFKDAQHVFSNFNGIFIFIFLSIGRIPMTCDLTAAAVEIEILGNRKI